jgi:hypothetical protein
MMDYDYVFSTCIELKRVPKNIWDCDIDKLKNAESIFLESCKTISRFMSTQYELIVSRRKDESDVIYDAIKRQRVYWSEDIPNDVRELTSTLIKYLRAEPKQNKRLFMLNLPKDFCKDPIKSFQLSDKLFVPYNLLEELLNQFCRNANCEIRVNKVPDIAYAVVPKLDTILETEAEVINNGIC